MAGIHSTLACNLDDNILLASLPLFESGKVEAIEWSFDTLYKKPDIPNWFVQLLEAYSDNNRLVGHGVYFSLFSGKWTEGQQQWLRHLEKMSSHFKFDHISEHFGFMTGEDFHKGAPMNIPFTRTTLEIGRDRLKRIYNACQCPVGLENLAFSYSPDEMKKHGHFLEALVEPINGFIILDLHNVYCQMKNFNISHEDILEFYPLDRVREIHISGGSWETSDILPAKEIRRDTHDESVPEEVFQLLSATLPKCNNVKYVVLEQLGTGLQSEQSRIVFRDDFNKMNSIVRIENKRINGRDTNSFKPDKTFTLGEPVEDEFLYEQQMELTRIIENASDYQSADNQLKASSLVNSGWEIENWDPYMVETALRIARKWKHGFV
jgi:uncharacterized protein (UPF0276 family)